MLFANAGIATFAPFAEVTEDAFDRTVTTNLKGTFFTVQTLLSVLRDGASVIITSSLAARKGFPAFSVYSATKAAIRSFARTLTTDLNSQVRHPAGEVGRADIVAKLAQECGQLAAMMGAVIEHVRHQHPARQDARLAVVHADVGHGLRQPVLRRRRRPIRSCRVCR